MSTILSKWKGNRSGQAYRSVKDEIRANLLEKLRAGEEIFPGIVGYEETVIPGIVNALLSRHNFILLGLRGQAKSRILRGLIHLLDEEIPVVEGSEMNEDPLFPISSVTRRRIESEGGDLPIEFLKREERYVEKLATPDVTVADIIGDLDPIKAARQGSHLSDFSNVHFGLLPRANRGIFAINELPDLAPKIQVALFNILQEGDVQIKGFPLRLPLDVLMVFSANPEDYTARGKIITPLKDRIGSEIRTHYPLSIEDGMTITQQEAWVERDPQIEVQVPEFVREIVESIAFLARRHSKVDQQSGVSQRLPISCLENVISNAERRALRHGQEETVARVSDIFSAAPSLVGKLELTYEGELRGGEAVASDLIVRAIHRTFSRTTEGDYSTLIQWFDLGGELQADDQISDAEYFGKLEEIQGIDKLLEEFGISPNGQVGQAVSLIEFVLEGLCSHQQLSKNSERGYFQESKEDETAMYEELEDGKISFS